MEVSAGGAGQDVEGQGGLADLAVFRLVRQRRLEMPIPQFDDAVVHAIER